MSLNGPFKLLAMKKLVHSYYQAGDIENCIDIAGKYQSLKPDDAFVHHFFARALSDSQKFDKAEEEFKLVVLRSNEDFIKMTYFYRALNFYLKKDYPSAIAWYKKVISIDSDFSFAYYNLAITYDDFYEDKKTAITYYEKYIRLAKVDEATNHFFIESAEERLKRLREKSFFTN